MQKSALCFVLSAVLMFSTVYGIDEICESEQCQAMNQHILQTLDTSADPCVDMFQFSCGGWIARHPLDEYTQTLSMPSLISSEMSNKLAQLIESEGNVFRGKNSTAVQKLKTFYRSCVDIDAINEKGVNPLIELIDDHGSWTVASTNYTWDEKSWDFQEALGNAHKLWGSSFWSWSVQADSMNNSRKILYFSEPSVTLKNDVENYGSSEVYMKFLYMAQIIGAQLGADLQTVYDKIAPVYWLEFQLTKIFTPKESLHTPIDKYNKMTLGEFQDLLGPWIDLEAYMTKLFRGPGLTYSDEVVVTSPEYFRNLKYIIPYTNKETLANYIMWNFILPTMAYLPESFSEAVVQKVFSDEKQLHYRWEFCMYKVDQMFGFVAGALFVDSMFNSEVLPEVTRALEKMKTQFTTNLPNFEWIDDVTRQKIEQKVMLMGELVGYPDWILDPATLDAIFRDVQVEEGEFLKNYQHLTEGGIQSLVGSYWEPPEKMTWDTNPQTVNAFYNPLTNEMIVPAGTLQEPLISLYHPKPYFYGSLTSVLGHELIHAFDSEGRYYDQDGNLADVWSPHVSDAYDEKKKCFIRQYDAYTINGTNLSGLLTLPENIADNGKVQVSYNTYRALVDSPGEVQPYFNLTNDQLFFVGLSQFFCSVSSDDYAISMIRNQAHTIEKFRVIGSLSNSKEFSEAFNCPLGSPMNPVNKCKIW